LRRRDGTEFGKHGLDRVSLWNTRQYLESFWRKEKKGDLSRANGDGKRNHLNR